MILLLAFLLAICSTNCSPINPTTVGGGSRGLLNVRIYRLGKSEGKEWFFITSKMTWKDAKAYCDNVGARLASIPSENQRNFLNREAFFKVEQFRGEFWTSGRINSNSLPAYNWNNDIKTLPSPSTVFRRIIHFEGPQFRSCLVYHSTSPESHLDSVPCSAKKLVLCEQG